MDKSQKESRGGLEKTNHLKKSTPAIFDDIQPVEPQAGDCHEPKTRKVPNYNN